MAEKGMGKLSQMLKTSTQLPAVGKWRLGRGPPRPAQPELEGSDGNFDGTVPRGRGGVGRKRGGWQAVPGNTSK